jgi:putative transposase
MAGVDFCMHYTPIPSCAGIAKVFGATGPGKVVASAWGDRLLIKKYASSTDRCSRRISVGVRLLPRASIHGELLKLGIDISQATVSKYMVRHQKPPSQTWRTFLENHADCIAGIDFFTVPTATFRILYVFIVLSHDRRHIVHFNVTAHPTAQWTAQQLAEAFPFDSAPRYLLRDRDAIYGEKVLRRIRSLSIEEIITAPRSPWQNPFVERIIGSIRRDCLDHIIVLSERHLRQTLRDYFNYYHTCRTHLSLNKDPPETRTVEPPELGTIAAFPRVGGLHHQYGRIAA